MRWIRNIFALIAIACVVLWVVSYYYVVGASVPYWQTDSKITFGVFVGRASVGTSHGGTPNSPPNTWGIDIQSLDEIRDNINYIRSIRIDFPTLEEVLPPYGFKSFSTVHPAGKWIWTGKNFTFPLWLPTLLFGTWPAVALTRHIKRRYFTDGVCRSCGYDLRGSPSGICPECGRSSNPQRCKQSPPTST
jgi:hypothetical protein